MMLTMCVETDLHHADASAAVSHVAQREISRESRHRQTDSYSYSSNRSACTSHHVVPPGRMCRRSHPSFNACFESMMLLMHVAGVKRCEPRKLCVVTRLNLRSRHYRTLTFAIRELTVRIHRVIAVVN